MHLMYDDRFLSQLHILILTPVYGWSLFVVLLLVLANGVVVPELFLDDVLAPPPPVPCEGLSSLLVGLYLRLSWCLRNKHKLGPFPHSFTPSVREILTFCLCTVLACALTLVCRY